MNAPKCKDCGREAPMLYSICRVDISEAVCPTCGKICESCEQPPDRCICK